MSLLSANLEAFFTVAKQKSVQAAARELGLTQTAVTQRIRTLETTLRTTLFLRSRRGMALTHEGMALLRYCRATKDLEGETLALIQSAGRLSLANVHLTGPTSLMESRIVSSCLTVLREFPTLTLTFFVDDLESRIERLRQGEVQLAVLEREQVIREMDSKLLKPERYILVGAPSWRKRSLKSIVKEERIIDFDPSDRTTHNYLKSRGLLSVARPDRHFVNNNPALIQMFSRGIGYGVLTVEVAAKHLEAGDIERLDAAHEYRREVALAWYPRPQMPDYLQALIDAVS